MTDDKGDNITEPVDEVVTTATPDALQFGASKAAESAAGDNKLGDLMADAPAAPAPAKAPNKPTIDLEAEALRAAEHALAEGEKALSEAHEQLRQESTVQVAPQRQGKQSRELLLRVLLAVNVLAMVIVSLLPSPATTDTTDTTTATPHEVAPAPVKAPPVRQMSDPVNRAWQASEARDFASAISILEAYLDDNPRMHAAERLSVMNALSIYASRNNDLAKSLKYQQQARALEETHYLPDDLVKMAEAAVARGDQIELRRVWARFLLQQRQIPTWLYQHVAQPYLELGDSYRKDADSAAEVQRLKELDEATARLRAEAMKKEAPK